LPQLFSEVLGKEVRVPDDPRRIVRFSPAATGALEGGQPDRGPRRGYE
jgi:hypothetical protein